MSAGRPERRLARVGLVEGFYGAPWTFEERRSYFQFAAEVGLHEYLYAPKDDPYHRASWRQPYPPDDLERLAELAAAAERTGIRFTYAIAPALSMRFAIEADHEALRAKAQQLWHAGVRSFALLFDDVPLELHEPTDRERFGEGGAGTGRAHGWTSARFAEEFLAAHGMTDPLLVCPTEYAGNARSPYRDGFAAELPADALVLWTGSDIVVGEVTRDDIDAAADAFQRDLVLWDNFPVNDFDRTRVFLGPLLGRTADVAGSRLVGIFANPMVESLPSRFALAAVAEWAADPAGYDAEAAAARALSLVAGDRAEALAPLVEACSSWPPSAPRSERLQSLCDRVLDGDAAALDDLEHEFRLLAASGHLAHDPSPLERVLEPWLVSAHEAGVAGLAATGLLRRLPADVPHLELKVVRATLVRTETRFHDVLRTVVPPFVRAVLAKAGDGVVPQAARRTAVLVTGQNPAPGDRELAERLQARGFAVEVRSDAPEPDSLPDVLVVGSRTSDEVAARLAHLPVPLLAWGRGRALGLSEESGIVDEQLTLNIVTPGDPLAAGHTGTVRVHRSPGKLGWSAPALGARVVARLDAGQPAIVHYRSGAELSGGQRAPAPRVLTFLSGEGSAPWLLSPEGHDLVVAAIEFLAASGE